ncbi:MAG: PorV/PorQ family protein [Elusimicrobiota bacterium]
MKPSTVNCQLLTVLTVICQLSTVNRLFSDMPTAQFLLVGQGTRAEALGQAVVSNCFDYTAAYWNPAASAFLSRPELGFSYNKSIAETKYSFLSFIYPYKKVAFGLRAIGSDSEMEAYDDYGNSMNKITEANSNFSLLFGWKVVDKFSLGISAGQINMDLSKYSAGAPNVNLGTVFKPGERVSLALVLANLGGGLTFTDTEESQPQLVRIGFSVYTLKKRNMLISTSYTNVFDDETANSFGFGLEVLPTKYIALRAGIRQTEDDYTKVNSGLGLNFKHVTLDYALSMITGTKLDLSDLGTHHISLAFKFGKIPGEVAETEEKLLKFEELEKPVKQPPVITKPVMPKTTVQTNIAVADFGGKNVSQADASIVADFLRTELVQTGIYTVIEKANMDKILAEAAFQQTGCTTSECAVQIGKLLNVKQMVVGNLSKLMDTYYITVNLVEVETGKILASFDQEAMSAKELRVACKTLAQKLAQ